MRREGRDNLLLPLTCIRVCGREKERGLLERGEFKKEEVMVEDGEKCGVREKEHIMNLHLTELFCRVRERKGRGGISSQ